MSNNPKCPICQKGTMMFKDNHACECSQCRFQCHRGHLDHIAAAMELAIATAAYFTLATDASHKRLQEAGQRVLEVWQA